jgi:Flp pilus assembly protein TadG
MSMMPSAVAHLTRLRQQRSGAAAAEMALLLPLLFLMLFGVVQLGFAIYTFNAMQNSARTGARLVVFGSAPAAAVTAVRGQLPPWVANAAVITVTENVGGLARVRVSVPGASAALMRLVPMPTTLDADVTMPRVGDR